MITVTIIGFGNPPPYKCTEVLKCELGLVSFRTTEGFVHEFYGLPYVVTTYPDNQTSLFNGER